MQHLVISERLGGQHQLSLKGKTSTVKTKQLLHSWKQQTN